MIIIFGKLYLDFHKLLLTEQKLYVVQSRRACGTNREYLKQKIGQNISLLN